MAAQNGASLPLPPRRKRHWNPPAPTSTRFSSVEWVAGKLPMVLLAGAALALILALRVGSAQAQITFNTCAESNELACGQLTVPLSSTGAVPGTIRLAIRRRRAPVGEARSAVIALAGGPGQAAIPFTETFAEVLGPIISTRDLIVFDQRGTGLSGALKCKAFSSQSNGPPAQVVKRCAQQIGPGHGSYTTPETVADIEAIRLAGGYEKLVLYGTSYGTKVAEQYAQEHPSHVEALVLDSVVPPEGPEPLDLSTFAAVPRVLSELCAFHGCAHITNDPVRDLRRLVSRLGSHRLRASVFDGKGHRHTVRIGSAEMLGILIAGDLDPVLRAEFPAAIAAASKGDSALLGRLLLHGEFSEAEEGEQGSDPTFDSPLYFATVCEEEPFPWSRSANAGQRRSEVTAKIDSLPASAFAPFARRDVMPLSDMPDCVEWPFSSPAPPVVSGSLPAVPTLIISGAEDLRTPTANARSVAALIPGSHLLVVPNTGHSVLTTEPGSCAVNALHALFAARAIHKCKLAAPPAYLKPTPLAPEDLSQVVPIRGYGGQVGRTLGAVALSFQDLVRQLAIAIGESGGLEAAAHSAVRTGGLRGGWAALSPRRVRLQGYSYVPGVSLSGWTGYEQFELHVGGRSAADGVLALQSGKHLVGELGGVAIDIPLSSLRKAAGHSAELARAGSQLAANLESRLAAQRSSHALAELVAVENDLAGTGGQPASAALAYELTHAHRRGAGLR
ncbi:MAG TPA: alpha/beta fold hydrolase [Solirubrobacteraceae bacterium]|nr:alpha/beta fold hydrolase [Solirubrobacteraceae bacterium]